MRKASEDAIQAEIQRRVFEEEQRKHEQEAAAANQGALAEVTSLSQEEIARIAERVRAELADKQTVGRKIMFGMIVSIAALLAIGGFVVMTQYNAMVGLEEQVNTQWSQVENVYQRRYDLIPNLEETVKAYAQHEQELVQMMLDARTQAGDAKIITHDILNDQDAFRAFQETQTELSDVLQRVMVVMEDNPKVKADQNFLALQAQLEGSENRISVERKRFNEAVQTYNGYIKKFPQMFVARIFGFERKAYFQAQENAVNAPVMNMKK